ncbi:uncharacterized protein LOC100874885 isoform X4 [Megachile rotundata]|uniref:uncharacterized protein LOC100874885 isoform X4 n=1 Tax=Megachile rotundata TaxID=143995 RepID=UPI00061503ED|nr:PREDICTED: protein EMSY isoform X3 [Megachile rotundata]
MWSKKHETMTRDECRKCLRCLELDAYGSMVSVLRAQGPFTNEKQKLLQELAKVLHISNERHRAEVRRAVNDEKLATIAEQLNGPNTGTDWTIEGRRVIPLLPRLKARSAFTTIANSLALATVAANRRNFPVHEKTEDAKDSKESTVQESGSSQSVRSSGNHMNAVIPVGTTNITKTKGKIITTQNKLNTKIGAAILMSNNVSCASENNVQSDSQDISNQDSLNSKVPSITHNLQKTSNIENSNSVGSHAKRIIPLIHPNVKPSITKTITSNNSHQLMTVNPVTTVSNGPGPPQAKQVATLTCKKLPTTLSNQTTAKMGVTLNSNTTVNIAHHSDTKLGSKTNVIVIQKGQTKGVTLSHGGKEVLGTMIMGAKGLCVTSQHNASISVLPRHITLNNGDQAVTMLSTTNSSHTESVTSNIKSGNTIMFNLRQDVIEKSKTLSHLFESATALTSESKTVIQNTNTRLSKEPSNNDLHVQDKELVVKTDAIITTVKDEKHRKVKIYIQTQIFYLKNSMDPMQCLKSKQILSNSK